MLSQRNLVERVGIMTRLQPIQLLRLLLAAFMVYAICYIIWGPKISKNDGLGWDGYSYAAITKNLPELVRKNKLTNYSAGRILGPAVVHYTFKTFNIEATNRNIVLSFQIINLLSILFAGYNIWLVTKAMGWFTQSDTRWSLLLGGIIFNFAFLVFPFYYPVLTDSIALFLAALTLRGWILNQKGLIIVAILLSSFNWSALIPIQIVTLLWKFSSFNSQEARPTALTKFQSSLIIRLLCILASVVYVVLNGYIIYKLSLSKMLISEGTPPIAWLIPFSLLSTIAFGWYIAPTVLKNIFLGIHEWKENIEIRWALLGLMTVAICYIVIGQIGNGERGPISKQFLIQLIASSSVDPLKFLLDYILYFGPISILTFWNYNKITKHVLGTNIPHLLIMNSVWIFGLTGEARRLIGWLPFIMFFTVSALPSRLTNKQITVLIILVFLYSRVWYPIGLADFAKNMSIQEFPAQHYFSVIGYWMSHEMYLIQMVVTMLACYVMYRVGLLNVDINTSSVKEPTILAK
jgi:hypothetical protein